MKVNPVLHRILIKPDTVAESDDLIKRAKAAGLHIELDKREEAAVETAVVLRIGSTAFKEFGSTAELEGISVGTKVYFAKYSGKDVKENGERLLLVNDEDLIGVITDE